MQDQPDERRCTTDTWLLKESEERLAMVEQALGRHWRLGRADTVSKLLIARRDLSRQVAVYKLKHM